MIFLRQFFWQASKDCLFRRPRFLLVHGVFFWKVVRICVYVSSPPKCQLFHSKRSPACSNFLSLFFQADFGWVRWNCKNKVGLFFPSQKTYGEFKEQKKHLWKVETTRNLVDFGWFRFNTPTDRHLWQANCQVAPIPEEVVRLGKGKQQVVANVLSAVEKRIKPWNLLLYVKFNMEMVQFVWLLIGKSCIHCQRVLFFASFRLQHFVKPEIFMAHTWNLHVHSFFFWSFGGFPFFFV